MPVVKDVNTVDSILLNKKIDAMDLFKTSEFPVLKVIENKKYEDGKFLDEIVSISYLVVETQGFNKIRVKVEGSVPVVTDAELQALRQRNESVLLTFENMTITQYVSNKGVLTDSIKATSVSIVE